MRIIFNIAVIVGVSVVGYDVVHILIDHSHNTLRVRLDDGGFDPMDAVRVVSTALLFLGYLLDRVLEVLPKKGLPPA